MRPWLIILSLVAGLVSPAFAYDARVSWQHPDDPSVVGYRVLWGTSSRQYVSSVDVGYLTSVVIPGFLYDVQYFFGARSIASDGQLSAYSNEASILVPDPNQSPPTVAILSPANGASVPRGGTVTIVSDASDDGVITSMQVTVNGQALNCPFTGLPLQCNWRVPMAANKQYRLQSTAIDDDGLTAQSPTVTVIAN